MGRGEFRGLIRKSTSAGKGPVILVDVGALQPGPSHTVYPTTAGEARLLLEACGSPGPRRPTSRDRVTIPKPPLAFAVNGGFLPRPPCV